MNILGREETHSVPHILQTVIMNLTKFVNVHMNNASVNKCVLQ